MAVNNIKPVILYQRTSGQTYLHILIAPSSGTRLSLGPMSLLPTADLLALDITGLKSRLSKLRRYL